VRGKRREEGEEEGGERREGERGREEGESKRGREREI
jgi:hypothetical protein